MVQPVDLHRKVLPLTQTALPVILCIKVAGVGIPEPEEQLFVIVGLCAQMMMGTQKPFRKCPGLHGQHGTSQGIEAHDQVRLAAEHYFIV